MKFWWNRKIESNNDFSIHPNSPLSQGCGRLNPGARNFSRCGWTGPKRNGPFSTVFRYIGRMMIQKHNSPCSIQWAYGNLRQWLHPLCLYSRSPHGSLKTTYQISLTHTAFCRKGSISLDCRQFLWNHPLIPIFLPLSSCALQGILKGQIHFKTAPLKRCVCPHHPNYLNESPLTPLASSFLS